MVIVVVIIIILVPLAIENNGVQCTISLSFLVVGDWKSAPIHCSSRGILGQMIFGGQATSPAKSGHILGIAKSGALPFLLHHCSGDMQWTPDVQYNGGKTPAEETGQCKFFRT